MIDKRGQRFENLIREKRSVDVSIHTWEGQIFLNEGREEFTPEVNDDFLRNIGESLLENAKYLENDYLYRRYYFRSYLEEIFLSYPFHTTWANDFIILADKYSWPTWTIQCLPKLYVPLTLDSEDRQIVLAWQYLLDCIPSNLDFQITDRLCNKEICRANLNQLVAKIVAEISGILHKELRPHQQWSDSDFKNVILHGLHNAELYFRETDLAVADQIRKVRKTCVEDIFTPSW